MGVSLVICKSRLSETKKGYENYEENIFHLFLKTKSKIMLFGLGISNININRFELQECVDLLRGCLTVKN